MGIGDFIDFQDASFGGEELRLRVQDDAFVNPVRDRPDGPCGRLPKSGMLEPVQQLSRKVLINDIAGLLLESRLSV